MTTEGRQGRSIVVRNRTDRRRAASIHFLGRIALRFDSGCWRRSTFALLALFTMLAVSTRAAAAGPTSESILPATTKGYISVAQAEEMRGRWNQTQFGQMLDDEIMQPFVADLKKQLQGKFSLVTDKLGLSWDDLDGISTGEVSLALVDRGERPAAFAVTFDVTGRTAQADKLLAAVEQRFTARRGRKTTKDVSGVTLHVFTVPASSANGKPQETVYFIKDNVLCGIDDPAEAQAMLARFSGSAKDNLQSLSAFSATMERCKREAKGLSPELRWYAEPFGLLFASRTLQKTPRNPLDTDLAKIAFGQGFDAIKGVGGFVNLLTEPGVEVLHRTAIHAPSVPGKESDPLRWNLSMRMLQLPNSSAPHPPAWAPRMSASYGTLNVDVLAAFDNIGPIFDAIREHENAWSNTIESWQVDDYGPKVDVRKEFAANLGPRVNLITDYTTPITVESERSIVAIETKNEQAVAAALEKWMKGEGASIKRREMNGVVIWERVPPEAQVDDLLQLNPIFIPAGGTTNNAKKEEKSERVLPNSASCVAHGHLMLASDIEYLKEILTGFANRERLATCEDYQLVAETLSHISPGDASGLSFVRMDEATRPTYELIRQGKMPEAKSMLGKMLNNLLTTEVEREVGKIRKQRIDGSKLPSFESVRRYFGLAGRSLRSERDGWVISGVVLK
jgi:hypothetical protein